MSLFKNKLNVTHCFEHFLFHLLQVTRADYLSGRTALHFAAVSGHARCIRLVVADFVSSAPYEAIHAHTGGDRGDGIDVKNKYEQRFGA